MSLSPVVVFAYKRKNKLEECLYHLERNPLCSQTDLYIFADGPKNESDKAQVIETHEFIKEYTQKSIFSNVYTSLSANNKGLAESIISGVNQVIAKHNTVIVVEDDLIVSDDFLTYMNDALDYYKDLKKYGSISAYSYPLKGLKHYKKDIYTLYKGECWGWGTWIDRWSEVDWNVSDFDEYFCNKKLRRQFESLEIGLDRMLCDQVSGKIDSWAVRWVYYLFKNSYLTVYPSKSKTSNTGFDNSGIHCVKSDKFMISIETLNRSTCFEDVSPDRLLERECRYYPAGIKGKIKYFFNIL